LETSRKVIKGTKAGKLTAQVLWNSEKRYIVNEGGSRSGKTYSIMQVLIHYCVAKPGSKISIVSQSLPHLKRGALRDFIEIMQTWEWYDEDEHNKTDNVYHFDNGSYMEFFGLEDAGKARGAGRDILFVNEANLVPKAVFDQLKIRTTNKIILDLNPSDYDCWCYEVADGDHAVKIHSTYLDNPYLGPAQTAEIEMLKAGDETLWQVFGLGLRGTAKETIYTHWKLVGDIPAGQVIYGLDFGYNVPTALVRVTLHEGGAYLMERLYRTRMTTSDLVGELKGQGIGPADEIFCDAAEPKTIEELYRAGFNVKPADKDVTEGIRKVKAMPLYIHKDSDNLIAEIKKYKWKVDKNDKVLDEPEKENDHAMDAVRYAIYTKSKTPVITWGVI
jgi:phage terminase large subunit